MSAQPPTPYADITNQIAQQTTVHFNLGQDAIVTTEDKVRIVLMTHLSKMETRHAWVGPAGILIAIVTAFATATFRDFFFKAATWEAIFIVAAFLTALWFAATLRSIAGASTIEDVISELKRASKAAAPATPAAAAPAG